MPLWAVLFGGTAAPWEISHEPSDETPPPNVIDARQLCGTAHGIE